MKTTFAIAVRGCWLAMAASAGLVHGADLYWDVNSGTAFGDGSKNWSQSATTSNNPNWSTSSSGTVTTTNYNPSNSNKLSLQFGFGSVADGNTTSAGTINVGNSTNPTANNPYAGVLIFNASGTSGYTIQNQPNNPGPTITLNSGSGAYAGYGIIVNANATGDTRFVANTVSSATATLNLAMAASQTWQNNSTGYGLYVNVPVKGAFGLTTSGSGLISLAGDNTFSGGLTVAAGTTRLASANAASSGAVSVAAGATLDVRAAVTKNLSGAGSLSIGPGGTLTAATLPSGGLALAGDVGTLATLVNTASGTTTLGSLTLGGNATLSTGVASPFLASGVVTISGADNLLSLSGIAAAGSTYTLVQGSSLANTGGVSVTGAAVGNQTIALGNSVTVGRTTYSFTSTPTALQLVTTGSQVTLTWTGAVDNTWDYTTTNWTEGSGSTYFGSGDNARITSAAAITVRPEGVVADGLTVSNASGTASLTGGSVIATSLVKSGAGGFAFDNALTAGSVTLSGGTTTVGATGSLSATTIATNAALVIASSGSQTLAAVISGTGSLAYTGGSTLSLTGVSPYAGTLSVGAGSTLRIAGAGLLGSGTFTGAVVNEGTLELSGTAAQTMAGAISGAGGVTKAGSTAATLAGGNSYTGSTAVNAGTLKLGSGSALGTADGATAVAAGAALDLNGQSVAAEAVTVSGTGVAASGAGALTNSSTAAVATWDGSVTLGSAATGLGGAGNLTIAGNVGGSGGLTKFGEGVVTLAGTNTYTGALTVLTGTVQVMNQAALPGGSLSWSSSSSSAGLDLVADGTYSMSSMAMGSILRVKTSGTGHATLAISGNSTLGGSATKTLQADPNVTVIVDGMLDIATTSANSRNAQFQGAGDVVLNGMLFGGTPGGTPAFGLVKGGTAASQTGTLFVNNANTYNGVTQITAGTLKIGHAQALGSSAAGTTLAAPLFSGATLDLNGQAVADESLSMTGTTADAVDVGVYLVNSSATPASWSGGVNLVAGASGIGGSGDISITGTVTGSGDLRKVGFGTVALEAATNTGATFVDEGTLTLGAGSGMNAGGGIWVAADATLNVLGSASGVVGNAGTIAIGPGGHLTSPDFGGGETYAGVFTLAGSAGAPATLSDTGTGGFVNRVGAVTLGGNSQIDLVVGSTITASGNVAVSGTGNLLSLSGVATKGTTYALLSGSSILNTGAIAATGSLLGNQTIPLGSSLSVGRSTYSFTQSGTSFLLGVTGTQYALTWTGSAGNGLWDYTSVNWQSGGTGYSFDPGDSATIATAAAITVDAAGVAADTTTVSNAAGVVSLDGGTLTTTTLVKSGAGLFTANGTIAVSNGITLSGGTFQIGAAGSLGGGTYAGPIANNAAMVSSGTANQTLAGVISGTGSLTHSGAGTLFLTGTSTSTGGISIAAGSTLKVADAGVLGSGTFTGGIANDGTFVVSSSANQRLAGAISGSGAVTISTATTSAITLAGASSYTGPTSVGSGTLQLGSSTALGSTAAGTTVTAGGVLDLNGQTGVAEPLAVSSSGVGNSGAVVNSNTASAATVAGTVTLNDAATGFGGAGNTTFSGLVTGSGGFTKWGEGVVTLAGTANYTGGLTMVQAGTLRLQNPAVLTSGTLQSSNSASSATLDLSDPGSYSLGYLSLGQILRVSHSGTGAATLTFGSGALNGNIDKVLEVGANAGVVIGGIFDMSSGTAAARSMVTGGAGTVTFNGTLSGSTATRSFGLVVGGSSTTPVGTTILNSANSYNGDTVVVAGTLKLGNSQALGSTAAGTVVTSSTLADLAGGTLDLNGQTVSGESLSLNGAARTVSLANTNSGAAATWNGPVAATGSVSIGGAGSTTLAGSLTGSGVLVKADAGRLTLAQSSGYAGAVTVSGGTLALAASNSLAAATSITVASSATFDTTAAAANYALPAQQTLGGNGSVLGNVVVATGATLSPGASPGTLTLSGTVTLGGGGNYTWQMLSATGTAGSASSWDLLSVSGPLTIAATSADPFKIDLWTLASASPDVSGSAANFNASSNSTWKIASATGGISGFAANKFAIITSATNGTGGFANATGGGTFSIAQSGNDLNLVFTAGTPSVVTINVASGTQTQTQAGYPLLSGSTPVVKTGNGTLVLDQANTLSGSTTVQGGVLQLANGSALSASRLAVVAGGTAQVAPFTTTSVAALGLTAGTGLVDVTSGALSIASGMTAPDLVSAIVEGRGDGSWNGSSGITSSVAAADVAASTPRAVGWLDNGDGSFMVAYAAPGDTNIDWSIDILDASNFLALGKFDTGAPATWIEGDFSYDGIVDILDAADFFATGLYDAGNYNTASGASPTPHGVGLGQANGSGVAAVPEPAALPLLAVALAAATGIARRSRRLGR